MNHNNAELAHHYNAVLSQLDGMLDSHPNNHSEQTTYGHLRLSTAAMALTESRIKQGALSQRLSQDCTCGWFMYSSEYCRKPKYGVDMLLEAEWVVGADSYHAKYLGNGEYVLTEFIAQANQNPEAISLYRDITLVGRGGGTCTYRTWWQSLANGATQCYAQQLIAMEEA